MIDRRKAGQISFNANIIISYSQKTSQKNSESETGAWIYMKGFFTDEVSCPPLREVGKQRALLSYLVVVVSKYLKQLNVIILDLPNASTL